MKTKTLKPKCKNMMKMTWMEGLDIVRAMATNLALNLMTLNPIVGRVLDMYLSDNTFHGPTILKGDLSNAKVASNLSSWSTQ